MSLGGRSAAAKRGRGADRQASVLVKGHGMLDLIVKMLGRRPAQDLVAANRMARVTWIAIQQGRARSALEY
jgi:hypothetical protein